ncbi:MAG: hypothetical protein ACO3KD_07345 [Gaiellales bacterium]
MDADGDTGNGQRRIEVDPADVRGVSVRPVSYGAPPPSGGAPPSWLRRHRAKLALGLAIVELLALGLAPGDLLRSWIALLAIAILAVFLHVVAGRWLPYPLRQLTWAIALGQSLVALFPVFLGVGIVIVAVLLVFAALAGLVLLLGDRR